MSDSVALAILAIITTLLVTSAILVAIISVAGVVTVLFLVVILANIFLCVRILGEVVGVRELILILENSKTSVMIGR